MTPRLGVRLAALLLAGGVLAGGCTSAASEAPAPKPAESTSSTTPPPEPAEIALSVKDGATGVAPGQRFTATVTNGTIESGSLVGADDTVVDGGKRPDGSGWTSTEPLGYGKTYTLKAKATGADGKRVTASSTFTTAVPDRQLSVSINVQDGETVGVGMPVIFTFSGSVPDRAAAEKALRIETRPDTKGAFHWFSDQQVIWRPKEYWRSGTKVTVEAEIYGKHFGQGTYGQQDEALDFTVGEKLIAIADGQSHQMKVLVNDKVVRTMPLSMGKPSSSTPNGHYTVMSEHVGYTMDSSTYGVPTDSADGYETWVQYAVRLSYSGIFYHSAPWSVGDQGHRNVSHGCLNLSTENAAWLMDRSKRGDIVTVRNGGAQVLEPTDGWSVWQMSWQEWRSGGSA
ncbi:peptidoglycan transpeptidase precursor (ErfK-YbiS-YhnG family) [Prauserella shujinwangii]|uniref:Peptidoglycan transpeptidase (ErfK-YbiS-YhnG family) n=1 Tax=Prauserella shujinwangii TaxID=1453103 RepID=A0A2T0LZ34_9PSEU|nr:peptidoglycan transpeptidase precursor (ErfK-YbiS-YhnG family) [Prauserella shujinwangii]